MPLYRADIGTIETLQWGEGSERILLLHCAGSGPGSLATLAISLCTPGRMVIAPALNRYGETRVSGADAIEEHVAVVTWLFNHYAGEASSVSLFGHSMGGLVALLVAQRQVRCEHVVAYDPIAPGVLDTTDAQDREALAWDRGVVATLNEAVVKGEHERGVAHFIEAWNDTPWEQLPESVRNELVRAAPRLARETHAISHHDTLGLGADSPPPSGGHPDRCQVALITGDASPAVAGRMVARLAQRFPHASVCPITGAGHLYPITHGREIAKEIDRTLSPDHS